jgi:alkylation response protein AidB-like acyl-CoA dehydrogenase
MARGETRWCQGYSEPGAGSDLAGLQMRAVRDGDHYVLNGQKVWTSHADKADHCFCLVRTDPTAAKRNGISFVLFDMQTPGVTVRPITLISGASPFCEMFLDDVRVPIANRIGPEHGGWTVAKTVLGHERALISKMRDARPEQDESLPDLAKRHLGVINGRIADPILRDRIAQAEIDFECNRAMLKRAQAAAEAGLPPGPETLTFKLNGTEVSQRIKALKLQILGPQGLGWEGPGFDTDALQLTREWLRSRGNSIEGGSSEIQLNIIAKQVLRLPD